MNCGFVACSVAVLLLMAGAQQVGTDPQRTRAMHGYLDHLERLVSGVMRGDLDGTHEPAAALANASPPAGLPDAMTRYSAALTTAARQAAGAPSLTDAAVGVARILAACGACHRAMGVHPAIAKASTPALLTGTAGHMVAHRQALDRLLRGLLVPSDAEWREGAVALRAAPLHAHGIPDGAPLAPADLRIEEAIHRLSEEAVAATAPDSRTRVFSTLLARCADCHAARPPLAAAPGTARN